MAVKEFNHSCCSITFFWSFASLESALLLPRGSFVLLLVSVNNVDYMTVHIASLMRNMKNLLLNRVLYSDIRSILFRKYCIPTHCSVFSIPASASLTCQVWLFCVCLFKWGYCELSGNRVIHKSANIPCKSRWGAFHLKASIKPLKIFCSTAKDFQMWFVWLNYIPWGVLPLDYLEGNIGYLRRNF